MTRIPFNKPYLSGRETDYIRQAVESGKISGDGLFTKKCHDFFEERYRFRKSLLTTSCTDALEMSALLLRIREGDEVILPSYTFVSTANAFVLRGAKLVFADSRPDHPGMNEDLVEGLITPKTKAIVVVHYAGVACDMDKLLDIARRYGLFIVEDAAQAVESFYKGRPLGGIGHLAAFSFHETKNIISGEGGMLAVNDEQFVDRAEIIREKGTNRSKFFRGEVDKYNWVDVGSSFLPSEIIAAFLYAQLENLEDIQRKRLALWETYDAELASLRGRVQMPVIPDYATNNAHMYYLVCRSLEERDALIAALRASDILGVFHYQSLHKSPFYREQYQGPDQPETDRYADCLLRLPLFYELEPEQITARIARAILKFYGP